MIIHPSLPSGHTVFCDDIRHEVTGKVTLVGVYASVLILGSMPGILPKICCAITYRESPTTSGPVCIKLLYEVGGEDRLLGEANYEVPEELALPASDTFLMREMRMYIEVAPFEIKEEGILKARAFRGDDEIRIGSLRVQQRQTASADQSPSQ